MATNRQAVTQRWPRCASRHRRRSHPDRCSRPTHTGRRAGCVPAGRGGGRRQPRRCGGCWRRRCGCAGFYGRSLRSLPWFVSFDARIMAAECNRRVSVSRLFRSNCNRRGQVADHQPQRPRDEGIAAQLGCQRCTVRSPTPSARA